MPGSRAAFHALDAATAAAALDAASSNAARLSRTDGVWVLPEMCPQWLFLQNSGHSYGHLAERTTPLERLLLLLPALPLAWAAVLFPPLVGPPPLASPPPPPLPPLLLALAVLLLLLLLVP